MRYGRLTGYYTLPMRNGRKYGVSRKTEEILTGAFIGIVFGIVFFHKLIFGAELSDTDVELIEKTVQAEAGNQNIEGRRYVAAVIINRVDDPAFPDTVEGVLSQDGQFSTYKNLQSTQATWKDELATKLEIESRSNTEIMFFRAGHYGCGEPAFQCGDHYFSTMK